MGKRSKLSKEKRKARAERQKRLAYEEKKRLQAAPPPWQARLADDMRYFAEHGILDSSQRFRHATLDALAGCGDWRAEPEFADLRFDPVEAGRALERTVEAKPLDPAEMERLSETEREERLLDRNTEALTHLIKPPFQNEVLRRLERFRKRLRERRDWKRLAQAAAVEVMLRAAGESREAEDHLWRTCPLIHAVFMDAVREYIRLSEAADRVFRPATEALGGVSPADIASLSASHPVIQSLHQTVEKTPGLRDFIRHRTDEIFDEAMGALFTGKLNLGLFDETDLAVLGERFGEVLFHAGFDPTKEGANRLDDKIAKRIAKNTYRVVQDLLRERETPDRRAALYAKARQRLQELARGQGRASLYAATLLATLDDATPLAESDLFIRAFMGEMHQWLKTRKEAETDGAETDSAETDSVETDSAETDGKVETAEEESPAPPPPRRSDWRERFTSALRRAFGQK